MDNLSAKDVEENHVVAIPALLIFLIIFFIYCFWGSSCLQKLSSLISACRQEDNGITENVRNIDVQQGTNSPTIILLPRGRLLIVDGTVFARFHANDTGLDLLELQNRLLHEERNQIRRSQNNVEPELETSVKEPPGRIESQLPPSYDSIFLNNETPPSYSEAIFITVPGESQNLENANERIVA